ncbi:peptidase, S41 family [Verrucomicrobiia bacterium DG1235]|nr:peptidase, S41 family [Verrucomicrobiae bacterium DG1235]
MKPTSVSLLSQIEGSWEAVGYGKFLQVTNTQLREYHSNSYGCIETADQSQAQLLKDYAYIELIDSDTFFASPAPFGNKWLFTRANPLSDCRDRQEANALTTFDFFDSFMRQHYPFFEERGMDWESRSIAARSALSFNSSDQQLYNAMYGLLKDLGDPHTGLYAALNDQLVHPLGIYPRQAMPMIRANSSNSHASDDNLFLNWIIGQLSSLETKMIEVGQVVDTTPFYWSKFLEIGYLHIGSEGGFSTSGKLEDEISGLESALDEALSDLADCEAIVVDLTLNLGGYEWLSQTIAKRFAMEAVHVHSKTLHNASQVPPLDYIVEPSSRVNYHGPLYLLTSDVTLSAGEDLTLSLRALPQTRHYGLNTYGAISNLLPKPLPNGWGLTLSNEIYTDFEGVVWEGSGIVPDFEYNVYKDGINLPHYEMIEGFISYIREQRQLTPHLRLYSIQGPAMLVNQAEPGSLLELQVSEDLADWSQALVWQYQEPTELEIDPENLGESTFFRIKEIK